ncbi:MAG: hypothetical protein SCARUB_05188 [Candidatus Scalindua rubra]|uniref:DUF4382 domain-containing protein n=1 Tax=Candidatus Scalindua rubra TaxID=1872076 RepID=A0A1E3X2C3_9BACT|nr:MAG: hypothetical protein SCARUB_05188 [Candidatus Scalindua rubra]
MKTKLLLMLSILFFAISCEEENNAIDETLVTFTIKLSSSNILLSKSLAQASFQIADQSGTLFTITESRVNVRHIQFDLPEESDTDSSEKVSLDGPLLIDLITGEITPPLDSFSLETGTYKRIDIRLDDSELEDGLVSGSDPLLDNTMIVEGTFEYDGNSERQFQLILKFNEDIRFEDPAGIVIDEIETTAMVLNLVVDEWLENIDITSCLDDGDLDLDSNGNLIINDNNGLDCQDIESTIKTNIKNNYDFD